MSQEQADIADDKEATGQLPDDAGLVGLRQIADSITDLKDSSVDELKQIKHSLLSNTAEVRQINDHLLSSAGRKLNRSRKDRKQVRVLIRANILTLGDIDTVRQEFSVVLSYSVWYKEPELRGKKNREEVDWANVWDPRITLTNDSNVEEQGCNTKLIPDPEDDVPIVQIARKVRATIKSDMNLEDFPFDQQELQIKLYSEWRFDQVDLSKNYGEKDILWRECFTDGGEWTLCEHIEVKPEIICKSEYSVIKDLVAPRFHTPKNQFAQYYISMHVQRKWGFYMTNIALIMFLLMTLSFTTFAIPHTELSDRMEVTLTLLLTTVAFKLVVSGNLPNLNYLTLLDKYVLFCLVLQCLVAVQNAVASLFSDPYDHVSIAVLAGMAVVAHLWFGILILKKVRANDEQRRVAENKYKALNERIDQAHRQRIEEVRIQHPDETSYRARSKLCKITGFTDDQVADVTSMDCSKKNRKTTVSGSYEMLPITE